MWSPGINPGPWDAARLRPTPLGSPVFDHACQRKCSNGHCDTLSSGAPRLRFQMHSAPRRVAKKVESWNKSRPWCATRLRFRDHVSATRARRNAQTLPRRCCGRPATDSPPGRHATPCRPNASLAKTRSCAMATDAESFRPWNKQQPLVIPGPTNIILAAIPRCTFHEPEDSSTHTANDLGSQASSWRSLRGGGGGRWRGTPWPWSQKRSRKRK